MSATCTTTPSRKILERTISASQNGAPPRRLRLAMLGCEDKPPYGPTEHTASLFLDLICKTLQDFNKSWTVSIGIYRVQEFDYPTSQQEWNSYDGIILPGSFSAAYDHDEWIEKLRQVILEEIHEKARPTLGICFGHQVMASAFEDGEAVKNPLGSQAGRRSFPLTSKGKDLLMTDRGDNRQELDLYYTHADMVKRLPTCAVTLGGTDIVPIQAAAYYRSQDDAESSPTRPIAITFQAHPEYASPELGLKKTLGSILEAMQERGDISSDEKEVLRQDSIDHYAVVEQDSIELMKTVGIRLGWFPNEKC
mmetsp:Transcript_22970/g.41692  ORF Transcript_22970/g.41692 Transcript_22970/m.41692 type:complete len:308 (+) Transcript_22970:69-992(+)